MAGYTAAGAVAGASVGEATGTEVVQLPEELQVLSLYREVALQAALSSVELEEAQRELC